MKLPTQTKGDRRRSERFELRLPVVVKWVGKDGSPREEATETQVVSTHGCLLLLKVSLLEGQAIELVNPAAQAVRQGRVIWCGQVNGDGRNQVAIELEELSPEFWGPKYAYAAWLHTLSNMWVG